MKEELEEIINLIEKNSDPSQAYIDLIVDRDDFSTITGNPLGLRLLASELLKRSIEIEEGYLVTADIPDAKWVLNDNLPLSIVGVSSSQIEILSKKKNEENEKPTGSWGCVFVLVIIIALIVLGVIYLINLF
ncbi:hypothetical protein [Terrimonas pollutisoli]|uniref:hypothetical protein n=1 Tax=Terrimonas pollutisoli TaxID=3034147 RepID=UPI0023EBDC16|nr:hypothetical protein [Terrimonas sp. H1YJ31]